MVLLVHCCGLQISCIQGTPPYPVSYRTLLQFFTFQPLMLVILTRTQLVLLSISNVLGAVLCLPRLCLPHGLEPAPTTMQGGQGVWHLGPICQNVSLGGCTIVDSHPALSSLGVGSKPGGLIVGGFGDTVHRKLPPDRHFVFVQTFDPPPRATTNTPSGRSIPEMHRAHASQCSRDWRPGPAEPPVEAMGPCLRLRFEI